MDIASISIIVATLLGPILAVQAQKAVERARDRHNRKSWLFHSLMATRAARVSPDHVQALNMIDLAIDVGYRFDRVQLKKGAYSPIAHGELEFEQQQVRKLAIDLLSGANPLKMEVTGFPIDPAALKSQQELQAKLAAALEGRGRLSVEVVSDPGALGDTPQAARP